jgi:predicted NAD/FAD-binding protein
VAVVGGGVSGLTAAYVLSRSHDVTLFEADGRFGGHAHTHEVETADSARHRVDSGFIVHNERTYPNLLRLFRELGVRTRATEMSMSVTCAGCGLSYAGGRGVLGILAQSRRVADPGFLRMISEVPRFHRLARRTLADASSDLTWSEWLERGGFSDYFVQHFALPLVSCVWSSGEPAARDYPARHLFAFLDHHGMLSVSGSPTWRTVVGGSASYVETLIGRLDDARAGSAVTAVERHDDGVDIRVTGGASYTFDQAVIATHADDALGAIGYSQNRTVLHRDGSVLPRVRRARASWNYRMASCAGPAPEVLVSYWMNRLQGIDSPDDLVVTLNPGDSVHPDSVVASMAYRHPVFTTEAVAAATRLRVAGGPRLAFAGAHLGWGFHEDGCRSGVEAAQRLGGSW